MSMLDPLDWERMHMTRRNSGVQQIPFMDFSFFPVKEDTNDLEQLPDHPVGDYPVVTADAPILVATNNSSRYLVSDYDDHSSVSDPSESSGNDSSTNVPYFQPREHSGSQKSQSVSAYFSSQKFKPFHEEKWSMRYKELHQFYRINGHSAVPHTYPKNPQLARWVKRQRRQYKLLQEGKASTMTSERLDLLNSLEFIWDSHDLNWREKHTALTAFKNETGHANVPSNFRDKKLATWVKCQRRQYKLYCEGRPSAMSHERIAALEKTGFEWEIRTTNSKPMAVPVTPTPSHVPSFVEDPSKDMVHLFSPLSQF